LGNNNKYRKILSDRENITEDLVDDFVYKYLEEVENGTWKEGGWPDWTKLGQQFPFRTYSVSKLAVNAYVSALHNTFAAARGRKLGQLVTVFSCCPGLVDTDLGFLGRPVPKKTPEQGADTPVWLALYSPKGGSGKFWSDRNEKEF
jgi:carbonyl reductase 1